MKSLCNHSRSAWLIAGVFATLSPLANAQTRGIRCETIPDSTVQLWGGMSEPIVQGEYAFTIADRNKFHAIDLSIPESPTALPYLELSSEADRVAVDGDRAYLMLRNGGVLIIDISDPALPIIIEEVLGGEIYYAVENGTAYTYERHVFKTSDTNSVDPAPPGQVVLSLGNSINSMYIKDQTGFVSTRGGLLIIFDLTDPSNPTIISETPMVSTPKEFLLVGSILYTGNGIDEVVMYDVSDMKNPVRLGDFIAYGDIEFLSINGDRLFVITRQGRILVLDVSDPEHPFQIGRVYMDNSSGWVFSKDNNFYASFTSGLLSVFNVTTVTTPFVQSLPGTRGTREILFKENLAYFGAESGLQVFDVTDQSQPVFIGSYDTTGSVRDLELVDSIAYIVEEDQGLVVLDVSDPASIQRIGRYETLEPTLLTLIGDLIALVSEYGIEIVSINDPTFPRLFSIHDRDNISGIGHYDGHVILAEGHGGFSVVSIQNPFAPTEISSLDMGAFDLTLDGHTAYTTGSGFAIIDLTDPESPSIVFDYKRFSILRGFSVNDQIVYFTPRNRGIQSLDISDRNHVTEGPSYPGFSSTWKSIVREENLYVLYSDNDVEIFNASDRCTLCTADFDKSGTLDFFDVSIFLDLFASQAPQADLTNDGILDFFDISAFLDQFSTGCEI